MRLFRELLDIELDVALATLNEWCAARYLVGLYPSPQGWNAVLRFEDYPGYLFVCERRGVTPISVKEYFS